MIRILALMVWGLSAASLLESAARADEHPLAGTRWVLTKVQGVAVPGGSWLSFEADRITGSSGCNRFWAPVDYLPPPGIDIGAPQSARIFCPGAMSIERAYLASLETVVNFRIDGVRLQMMLDDGDIFLEFERDPGHRSGTSR
ncbi:MAG: META domain-containing protein [Hyphomicrobium sp.]|nr:META domain-containing protein [Hyphomicrobium sp.]